MGGVGWGLQSHFIVKPNLVLRLGWGWGFDNFDSLMKELEFDSLLIFNIVNLIRTIYLEQVDSRWIWEQETHKALN